MKKGYRFTHTKVILKTLKKKIPNKIIFDWFTNNKII